MTRSRALLGGQLGDHRLRGLRGLAETVRFLHSVVQRLRHGPAPHSSSRVQLALGSSPLGSTTLSNVEHWLRKPPGWPTSVCHREPRAVAVAPGDACAVAFQTVGACRRRIRPESCCGSGCFGNHGRRSSGRSLPCSWRKAGPSNPRDFRTGTLLRGPRRIRVARNPAPTE